MADALAFLQQFLIQPRQIGSVIPSSPFLEQRIIELAEVASADVIVELGAGTGGTTRAILAAMAPQAKLLSIEINPVLHSLVSAIDDPRLYTHCGTAEDLAETLALYRLDAPHAVISGIPFSTMDRGLGTRIAANIAHTLASGGRFVAYQVSSQVAQLTRPFLGAPHVEVEFRNIPPLRVYRWEKI